MRCASSSNFCQRVLWTLFGACVISAALGCGLNSSTNISGGKPAGGSPLTNPAMGQPVEVKVVDRAGFQAEVDKLKGKVVLVDFWATWCDPCRKQFPHTVELAHRFREQGLAVISVAFDDAASIDEVRKFLSQQGADFENLVSSYGYASFTPFDTDNGAIPCYWIYDREGKLAERISPADPTKTFRPQQIDEAVERLLAAAPATQPAPAEPAPAAEPPVPAPETKVEK